jgi:RNA polymerase sigma factor (sigma-70 family)
VARLFARAEAGRWGLTPDRFGAALAASAAHAFGGRPLQDGEADRYLDGLHLTDLALAAACADGNDAAWEHFVREFRPALYRAADAMDAAGRAREAVDSLYGDLFGLTERDGVRRSLFLHYHGRSRLSTWLRAVLSQRFVDRIRATKRLEPLPDDEQAAPAAPAAAPDLDRGRFATLVRTALAAAIAALVPRDRLRLDCYYRQDLTLAAIGRLLGEHEATVSRHLTRTRKTIRDCVERSLRDDHGLDDRAIVECLQAAVQDAGTLDLATLVGAEPGKKIAADRSS